MITRLLYSGFRVLLALVLGVVVGAGGVLQAAEPVERTHFVFYFDSPQYIDPADSILLQTRRILIDLLHDSLTERANVYLVDNVEDFGKLLRGRFPDWGAAAAYAPRQQIVVKSPDRFNLGKSLAELLAHEYTHLALAGRTGFHDAPRWFEEGMAQLVSTEWSWEDNVAMSKAAILGQYIPLPEIEYLNRFNQAKAQIAYAQSYLAVKFFFDEYGREAVNIFLDEIRFGGSLDEALLASTGSNYAEFENEFEQNWSTRFNIITLLADTMWLWLGLSLVVVIGAFLRYRKRRSYYEKWEEEENYQSTDFDYGDPDHPERTDDDEPWRR